MANFTVATPHIDNLMSSSFLPSVPPVLSRFSDSISLLNDTAVLMFSINQNATPSVAVGDVTVQLSETDQANERLALEIKNYTIFVIINQLQVCDSGNYTITVATSAGKDVAWTYLTVEG